MDDSILLPHIAAAATTMKDKLTDYKKDQLPGGKYWAPDDVRQILRELKPHNDICKRKNVLLCELETQIVH